MKKAPNKTERQHMQRVAELGCIACSNLDYPGTPAEIHHLRDGCGTGQRGSHFRIMPLCHAHHRTGGYGVAIHAGQKVWQEIYGTEESLLLQVEKLLNGEPA